MILQVNKLLILIVFLLPSYLPLFGSDHFHSLYDSAKKTSSVKIATQALEVAFELRENALIAKSYYLTALLQSSTSMDFKALNNYFSALDYYRRAGNKAKWEINTLINISMIYTKARFYEKAISFLEDGLVIADNNNQQDRKGYLYYNLGFNYRMKNNAEQAEYFHKKALGHFQSVNNITELSKVYTELGLIHLDNNNFEEAKRYYDLSVSILDDSSPNKKITILKKSNSLGYMYMQQGNWNAAKREFYSALQQSAGVDAHVLFDIYDNLASIYKEEGLRDSAVVLLGQSVKYADKQLFDQDYLAACEFLYDHYHTDLTKSRSYHEAISAFAYELAERQEKLNHGYEKYQVEAAHFLREIDVKHQAHVKERNIHYVSLSGLIILAVFIVLHHRKKEARRAKQAKNLLKQLNFVSDPTQLRSVASQI